MTGYAQKFRSSARTLLRRVAVQFALSALPITMCHAAQGANAPNSYVGSLACRPCHEKEYKSFTTNAKKSKSYQSIARLIKGLSPADLQKCYFCHTTGYGRPGGFVSPEKTPHLKNAGCEVCHGPGAVHVKSGAARDIKGTLTMKDCESCHISERVNAFRYKPLIHGGAH